MLNGSDVVYSYDGTLCGLLCCVYESFYGKNIPCRIISDGENDSLFKDELLIESNPEKAERVLRGIYKKIGENAAYWVKNSIFSCHPEKELLVIKFLELGFKVGKNVTKMLHEQPVRDLQKAVNRIFREAHLLKGFTRFSDVGGNLVAVIEPKNLVLPLLAEHFVSRYPSENFLIYDKTYKIALVYENRKSKIISVDGFEIPDADETEEKYRRLWKNFYDTVGIDQRYNPKCRMNLMPKYFWKNMTEFQTPAEEHQRQSLHALLENGDKKQLENSASPALT